eukprot:g24949.t1
MAEELNRYFASVFMVDDISNVPELQECQGAEVRLVAITKEKVLGKLKGLRVLKEIAEEIVQVLVVIIQESLESGRVPENWKMANVTALFRKGGRQKMGNYRLISLTSAV